MRCIYLIKNNLDGKVYVGQSKNPTSRKKNHWAAGRHNRRGHLYDAMRKHGIDHFCFSIIEECDDSNADDRERFWISHYDSMNPAKGYNRESGGCAHKTLSEETRKKLSEANKGVPFTEERCKNISDALNGKPNLKNRSDNNPQRCKNISDALTGRTLSDKHKAAVSESLKHYFETHEVRHTEESRRNMSDAQKIVGARRSATVAMDPSHPDAQPKVCPHCGESFSPKKMSPSGIRRHVAKKFCSKTCAICYNNKHLSVEKREKIRESKSGMKMSDEARKKISDALKAYRRRQKEFMLDGTFSYP